MAADPIAAIVALLAADADVAALVGARVFGGELPAAEAEHMPRPAIVVSPTPGGPFAAGSTAEIDLQAVDLLAYGETPYEAGRVMRAAAAALDGAARVVSEGALIHWARPAGGPAAQREPEVAWPVSVRPYEILYAVPAAA